MRKILLTTAMIVWSGLQLAMAQGRPVKGQIRDEKGEGIPGASVQVKDGKGGTTTDADGNFSLDVPDGKDVLIINAIGFGEEEFKAGDGASVLNIKLTTVSSTLDETVIIGYGSESRKNLIGASSQVKGEEFHDVPVGNFTNMLQGKAAGVQVTAVNGKPGAPAFIRIRGIGSITGGNDPLIVIDGVPSTAEAYSALNPNDIADVSILKDASTTGIYGSRGSNGVVVVTTKLGQNKNGKPQVTYGFQYGFKNKTDDNFKMMDFYQKLNYERDLNYTNDYLKPLLANDGLNSIADAIDPYHYWNQLLPYKTNWLKEILRTGKFMQNDLSVSGSTDRMNYYSSFQIYDEDGISLGSNFKRKSGNINVDYKATNWLKVGQSIRVAYSTSKQLRDIYNAQNPFAAMYSYNPYESPYDFSSNGINGYNYTTQGFNVIEAIQNNPSSNGTLYGQSTTFLEITPIKDLIVRTQLGLQYSNSAGEYFIEPGSILDYYVNNATAEKPVGSKTDNGYNRFNYVWTNTAQYRKIFNQDHSLKFLLGTEFTKENYGSYSFRSKGYLFPNLNTQENGATPISTTSSKSAWALMSYFARAEYSYKGKYAANLSLRRDGSSRFGTDTKYGNFLAGGLSWNISDENFLKESSVINYLKLWGSVGTSGNNQIGNYTHLPLYVVGSYNSLGGIYPNGAGPGNENLTWEKNTSSSIGVDFVLVRNLTGTIDVYSKYTHSLLLNQPISATTGYTSQTSNIGDMRNTGLEVTLNYNIFKTKEFTWSVGGNLTLNKNRIVKLVNGKSIPDEGTTNTYYDEGKPIDVYYMQKSAGIDPVNGDELWYAADGITKTNSYKDAGQFYLGNKSPNPTFYGGFNTNLNFKGLELGVDFYYSGGNYIYNNQWEVINNPSNVNQNLAVDALNYWTPTNVNAPNPKPNYNNPDQSSDRWLQKGNFIRLRNLTVAYNLPRSIAERVKMQGLRIYIQGQNLWYHAPHYKGDPEVGIGSDESGFTVPGTISLFSYPQTRAITCGLNVTF